MIGAFFYKIVSMVAVYYYKKMVNLAIGGLIAEALKFLSEVRPMPAPDAWSKAALAG